MLDENCFKIAQKTMTSTPPSFKIGGRVYFKSKQLGKWDLKWRPGSELSKLSKMDIFYIFKTKL